MGDLLFFLSFLFSLSSSTEGDLLPPGVTSITDGALAPSAGGTAVCQLSCPGSHTTEGDFLPTSIIEGDLPLGGLGPLGFRPLFLFPLPPRLQMPLGVFFATGAVVGGDPAAGIFAGGDLDGVLE